MKIRLSPILLMFLSASFSFAATVEKNNVSGSLSEAASWTGATVPGSGDVAGWTSSSAKGTESDPLLLGGNASWAGISYNIAESGALFIGGDAERKTLTLGTSGISSAKGNHITIGADVVIGGNQGWRGTPGWGGSSSITILGDLKGRGNLTTYVGEQVNATIKGSAAGFTGALEVGESCQFTFENGLTGGNINLKNDTRLTVSVQDTQTYSSNLSSSGYINAGPTFNLSSGTLILAGNNNFGAGADLGSRFALELQSAAGASLEFRTGRSVFSGPTRVSGGGSVVFAGTSTFSQKLEISGAGTNVTFLGTTHTVADSTGSIVVGSGATLDLSQGRLSFSGHINKANAVVVQGTLKLNDYLYGGSLNQLADYAQNRQLDGGTIEITGASHGTGNGTTISGKGGSFLVTNSGTTLTMNGNANSVMMDFAASGALKLGGAGNLIFNSHANQSFLNGTGVIDKVGSGTLTINGASNGFSGKMILSEGGLVLRHENALGSSSSSTDLVYKGGSLDMGGLALKNIAIEFDGTQISDVQNGGNFMGLLNVGRSGSYELSSATSFGSGFKATVDTEFVLQEDWAVGFKASGLKNYILGTQAVSFTGAGFNLSVSNYGATDGAVNASSISFHDMGNISFSGNVSASTFGRGGAMSAEFGEIVFERVGDIVFSGNKSNGTISDGLGGAFYSYAGGSMDDVGNVTFSSNSSTYSGGAVATDGAFAFRNAGELVFTGNESKNGDGGAMSVGAADLSIDTVQSLSVKNNKANGKGGAFDVGGDLLVNNVAGDIEFVENQATREAGGAIVSRNGNVIFGSVGNVSFTSNSAGTDGGGISAYGDVEFTETGDISFASNTAGGHGGAINAYGVTFDSIGAVSFENNRAANGGAISADTVIFQGLKGDVAFKGNAASSQGGALFIGYQVDLTADGGDISFSGNTAGVGTGGGQYQNSIHFNEDGASANLDALDGRSIVFEDGWSTNDPASVISVFINDKGADSTGQVKMTGAGSQMNVRANTTVANGSFVVEKGANYGYFSSAWSQDEAALKTELLIKGGSVVVGDNSSINSHRVELSDGAVLCVNQGAIVRAETININGGLVTSTWGGFGQSGQPGGTLQADVININGISFDLNGSPMSFSGSSINVGGMIALNDLGIDYTGNDWVVEKEFVLGVFGDANTTIEGMFGGIISTTSGMEWVYDPNDPARALGKWELNWKGQSLVASWTVGSSPAVPEPSTCLLLAFSLTTIMMRRRR